MLDDFEIVMDQSGGSSDVSNDQSAAEDSTVEEVETASEAEDDDEEGEDGDDVTVFCLMALNILLVQEEDDEVDESEEDNADGKRDLLLGLFHLSSAEENDDGDSEMSREDLALLTELERQRGELYILQVDICSIFSLAQLSDCCVM